MTSISHAEIYRYVDKNGNVTFTNMPRKGAMPLNIPTAPKKNIKTAKTSGTKTTASKKTVSTPANFPKEDSVTKNRRESLRAKILNQELFNEQNMLKQAESDSAKNPSDSKLKKQVLLHQKNIQAIHKELKGR